MKITGNFVQWFIVALSLFANSLLAATHYTFTSNTGNNMTVLVRTSILPTVNGASLAKGDEIGVFSTAGLCVGAIVWNDTNVAITVWGDNELTTASDGITANDTLRYRVWDVSFSQEDTSKITYSLGEPTYTADGVSILASFAAGVTTNTGFKPISQIKTQMNPNAFTVFDIQGKVLFKSTCNGMQDAESILSSNKACLSKSQYIISFESYGIRQHRRMAIK